MAALEMLHRCLDDDLQTKWVSPHSRWHDTGWRFDDATGGAHQKFIRWNRPLSNGSTLLDGEWSRFLDASKRLLWSLMTEPANGVPMKVGSIDKWQTSFWCFVEWMADNNYRDWSEIDSFAVAEYVDHFRQEKLRVGGKEKGAQSVAGYLQLLSGMWAQTDVLRSSGASTMPDAPFGDKNAFETAKEISEVSESEIPAVEDEVFILSMNELTKWLDFKGDDIVRALDMALDMKSKYNRHWVKWGGQEFPLRKEIADFSFSVDPSTGSPWHESLASCKSPGQAVRSLVVDMNMAGIIILQAATGMRISEVCGLEADPSHEGPFPSCVEVQSSSSGLFDVFYIKGKLFKTTSEWEEARWVGGLRPKGTDYIPPPIKAIILVEQLFRRWRREGGHTALFLAIRTRSGVPKSASTVGTTTSQSLDQHEWISNYTGAKPSVRVTSHQWRKAFAKWVFRTDKRLLPAIALHFKHVSLAMTEKYIGNDLELIENVDGEASRKASEVLFDMATGKSNLRGPTAKMLRDRSMEISKRLGNRCESDQKLDMKAVVEENRIRIWRLSHGAKEYGTCIFRPGIAICRKAQIGPLIRPDMAAANPGTCAGCTSFGVDEEHLPFWLDRYQANQDFYLSNQHGDAGVVMLAKRRMEQSMIVLGWFGLNPEQVAKEAGNAA